jgi:hypothetical protein
MRQHFFFFLFLILVKTLFSQVVGSRGTVMIIDYKNPGIIQYDSSTVGNKPGDVGLANTLKHNGPYPLIHINSKK